MCVRIFFYFCIDICIGFLLVFNVHHEFFLVCVVSLFPLLGEKDPSPRPVPPVPYQSLQRFISPPPWRRWPSAPGPCEGWRAWARRGRAVWGAAPESIVPAPAVVRSHPQTCPSPEGRVETWPWRPPYCCRRCCCWSSPKPSAARTWSEHLGS